MDCRNRLSVVHRFHCLAGHRGFVVAGGLEHSAIAEDSLPLFF